MNNTKNIFKFVVVLLFVLIVIYLGYLLFNELNFCPKGSVWIGSGCRGTGVIN